MIFCSRIGQRNFCMIQNLLYTKYAPCWWLHWAVEDSGCLCYHLLATEYVIRVQGSPVPWSLKLGSQKPSPRDGA